MNIRMFGGVALFMAAAVVGCATPSAYFEKASPAPALGQADPKALMDANAQAKKNVTTFALPISQLRIETSTESSGIHVAGEQKAVKKPAGRADKKLDDNPNEKAGEKTDKKPDDSGESLALGSGFTAQITQTESGRYYRVTPKDGFWSTTNIQITKLPNTDIPSAVNVDFTDKTTQRIEQGVSVLASAAKVIAGFASRGATGCSQATSLQSFSIRVDSDALNQIDEQVVPKQPCWRYKISTAGIDPAHDTVTVETFESGLGDPDKSQSAHYWPVPVCLDVAFELKDIQPAKAPKNYKPTSIIATVRVIDPRLVRLVGLPEKGKIAMHPVCSADVTNTPGDPYKDAFDAAKSVFDTTKSAVDAQKGAGKK